MSKMNVDIRGLTESKSKGLGQNASVCHLLLTDALVRCIKLDKQWNLHVPPYVNSDSYCSYLCVLKSYGNF